MTARGGRPPGLRNRVLWVSQGVSFTCMSHREQNNSYSYCSFIIKRGFPDRSVCKESACNVGDPGTIPGLGRSAAEGTGYPLQYSWASLLAQLVKNPPAMRETWVEKIPWRRERLPTPVFWPGEFRGLYSPWGRKELDRIERLSLSLYYQVAEPEFELSSV